MTAVVAALLLLTACGGNPPTPKAAQSHPRPAPTASPTPTATPTPTLYPQVADAYKAAAAANPRVNFDL
ncbi:MAG TPA: thioredoxin-like selenoprotein, partial [Pseudonocardiaceae bacterium]